MKTCNSCIEFIKKKNPDPAQLLKLFTKIDYHLHFAFDKKIICEKISSYFPDTIVLAGNGSVEIPKGGDCWGILNNGMKKLGLVGPNGYGGGLDALTWLVAQNDLFGLTVNSSESLDQITEYKRQIIGPLRKSPTQSREIYCTCWDKKFLIPIFPPIGVSAHKMDEIQKELVNLSYRLRPNYHPIVAPVIFQEKMILLIWCLGGQTRPYQAPDALGKNASYSYFTRRNSTTVKAQTKDLHRLHKLANQVPFEDRIRHKADLKDLQLGIIKDFLRDVKSDLVTEAEKIPFEQIC